MSTTVQRPAPSRAMGYLFTAGTVAIWVGFSLSGRYAALGSGVRLTPWDLGALRYTVAGVVAGGLWLSGFGRGLHWRRSLVIAVVAGLGFPLPSYLGFTFAPAAHGAVILSGTLPFLVALGNWAWFGARWTGRQVASLAVLLAGILLLGHEAFAEGARPGAWRGDLLFLTSACGWAAYTLMVGRLGATPMQTIVAVGSWTPVLYLPVWVLLLPSHLTGAPLGEIVYQALFQGILAVGVSLYLFTRALQALGTTRLTTVTALVPGLAGVAAIPLLGEMMAPEGWAGLALVCLAVGVGVRRTPPSLPPPHPAAA